MLRTPVYKHREVKVGDTFAIWRYGSGLLCHTHAKRVTPYIYEVIHNSRIKTSGVNRGRPVNVGAVDNTPCKGNRDTGFPMEYSYYYTALPTATSA